MEKNRLDAELIANIGRVISLIGAITTFVGTLIQFTRGYLRENDRDDD